MILKSEKKQSEQIPLQSFDQIINKQVIAVNSSQKNKYFIIIIIILLILLISSITITLILTFNSTNNSSIKIISYGNEDDITYIFGHKNPDTDTICSAIIASDLEKLLGNKNKIIPCRLGELSSETKYILNYFNIQEPLLITNLSKAKNIILVDHNQNTHSIKNLNISKILKIYDHHGFYFMNTYPIEIISKPYGSTTSILYEIYKLYNFELNKKIAGLILGGILSDTFLFHLSTTTEYDKIYAIEVV